jgi:hypothetical protein
MDDIKKNLEARKDNLIFLLKNKKEFLELEKQHQIYGAIKEIDYILRMLYYASRDEPSESIIIQNEEHTSIIRKLGERARKFRSPIKIKFQKDQE